jgi:hypothetical protein
MSDSSDKDPLIQEQSAEQDKQVDLMLLPRVELSIAEFNRLSAANLEPDTPAATDDEIAAFMAEKGLTVGKDIIVSLDDGRSLVIDTRIEDFGTVNPKLSEQLATLIGTPEEGKPTPEVTEIHSEQALDGVKDLGVEAVKDAALKSPEDKSERQKQELFEHIGEVRNQLGLKLASFADQFRYREDRESEGKTKVELIRDIFVTVGREFDNGAIDVNEASRKLEGALTQLEADIMAARSPFDRTELARAMSGEAAQQFGDKEITDLDRTVGELNRVLGIAEGDLADLKTLTNRFIASVREELQVATYAARERGQTQSFRSAIEFATTSLNNGILNADYELRLKVKLLQDNLPDIGK